MAHDAELDQIRAAATWRGITRLCHFTQSRALPLISESGAILSTARLRSDALPHHPNDPHRLDGHLDHVSCPIQYPNARNLNSFRHRPGSPEDWVVVLIRPSPLWHEGTLFCRRNAATLRGGLRRTGFDGFEDMFAADPGRPYGTRRPTHLPSRPTADQAEVLVFDRLDANLVTGVVVADDEQAERERERLLPTGWSNLPVLVCAEFFVSDTLKRRQREGPGSTRNEERTEASGDQTRVRP